MKKNEKLKKKEKLLHEKLLHHLMNSFISENGRER